MCKLRFPTFIYFHHRIPLQPRLVVTFQWSPWVQHWPPLQLLLSICFQTTYLVALMQSFILLALLLFFLLFVRDSGLKNKHSWWYQVHRGSNFFPLKKRGRSRPLLTWLSVMVCPLKNGLFWHQKIKLPLSFSGKSLFEDSSISPSFCIFERASFMIDMSYCDRLPFGFAMKPRLVSSRLFGMSVSSQDKKLITCKKYRHSIYDGI